MTDADSIILLAAEHPLPVAFCFLAFYLACRCAIKRLFRPRFPQKFSGRVVYVCDGDTIWLKTRWGKRVKLRLVGMDAPESDQSYGKDATLFLKQLLQGKTVAATAIGFDVYGRLISKVVLGNADISELMIENGWAWPYRQYFNRLNEETRRRYDAAGARAKTRRAGLWQEASPLPPWKWREQHRSWAARLIFRIKRWIRKIFFWI